MGGHQQRGRCTIDITERKTHWITGSPRVRTAIYTPGTLDGTPVHLRKYPGRYEVISPRHLRSDLHLLDGDPVTIWVHAPESG